MNRRAGLIATIAFAAGLIVGGLATHTWFVPTALLNARKEIAVLRDLLAKQQAMIADINAVLKPAEPAE